MAPHWGPAAGGQQGGNRSALSPHKLAWSWGTRPAMLPACLPGAVLLFIPTQAVHKARPAWPDALARPRPHPTLTRICFLPSLSCPKVFFGFYQKLAGMTGTAQAAAAEFFESYKLKV